MADPNDTNNHGKVSDSAYSNSSSNSQCRRSNSQSSKSNIHSGSNSSGSSGYGDNPSSKSSGTSNNHAKRSKDKDSKKKPHAEEETEEPQKPVNSESPDVQETAISSLCEDRVTVSGILPTQGNTETDRRPSKTHFEHGFYCVVSHDEGVIMYSTAPMYGILGYPKEMWIGRNFIECIHTRDQAIFAAQMSSRFVLTPPPLHPPGLPTSKIGTDQRPSVYCRLRRYTGLSVSGFAIKDKKMTFIPCKIYISLKDICENDSQKVYMVIQVVPVVSAYQEALQPMQTIQTFITRHTAAGIYEYVDPESVPYLGYLPHLLVGKCAIQLYHPDDLSYLRSVYESMVKSAHTPKASYRMLIQNGDYVRVETEWNCFVNPWSRKLEFVTGLHLVTEGPANCNIFERAESERGWLKSFEDRVNAELTRATILRVLSEFRTKPAVLAKQKMVQKCQNISLFMEKLMEDAPRPEKDPRAEVAEQDMTLSERDSVLLGGVSPHHDFCDSKSSSTDTTPSYNQLNYKENLQRFFESRPLNNMYDNIDVCFVEERRVSPVTFCSVTEISESASVCCESTLMEVSPPTAGSSQHGLTESALVKHNVDMERGLAKQHRKMRRAGAADRMRLRHLARCSGRYQAQQPPPAPTHNSTQPQKGAKRAGPSMPSQGKQRKQTAAASEASPAAHAANVNVGSTTLAAHENRFVHQVMVEPNHGPAPGSSQLTSLYTPNYLSSNWPLFTSIAMEPTVPITVASTTSLAARLTVPLEQGLDQYGLQVPFANIRPARTAATSNVTTSVAFSHFMRTHTSIGLMTVSAPIRPHGYMTPSMHTAPMTLPMALRLQPVQTRPVVTLDATTYSAPFSATATVSENSCAISGEEFRQNRRLVDNMSHKNSDQPGPSSLTMANDLNSSSDHIEERTDAETSSSFYSSFLKTDSASAEDDVGKSSSDKDSMARNRSKCMKWMRGQSTNVYDGREIPGTIPHSEPDKYVNEGKMKPEPPWMDQVSFSFDLHYQYKVPVKSKEEIREADRKFLAESQQSQEVNDQLGQLYLDLQMQGLTSRLTLEEGLTSSGSSGDDSITKRVAQKKRRPYSKVEMLFEENAPMPPPDGPFLLPRPLSKHNITCEGIPIGQCDLGHRNEGSSTVSVDSAIFVKPTSPVGSLHRN